MRLNDTESTFFALLRSGMYGTPIPEASLPGSIDWEAVVGMAKKQAVYGVIIDSIQFLPAGLRPTGAVAAAMNKFALGLIQTNIILDQTVARLVSFFNEHGISGVLLKGQGVALSYYRVPQIRQTGDIDFYVGKAQYARAVSLCREHLAARGAGDETEQHFSFSLGGVHVELHRLASRVYSPLRARRFQRWTVEELEHSPARRSIVLADTSVTLPSYDFDAVYIFYHAWRHFIMGGIGLRQLCDWALILRNRGSELDADRVAANVRRFGIEKGWKLFGCIAVDHLGVPPERVPLYDPAHRAKSERVLEEILAGGNFGHYSRANTRTPIYGSGLWHGLGKVRNITGYFIALFPMMPVEATFLYFNRLFTGTITLTRRSMRKSPH